MGVHRRRIKTLEPGIFKDEGRYRRKKKTKQKLSDDLKIATAYIPLKLKFPKEGKKRPK